MPLRKLSKVFVVFPYASYPTDYLSVTKQQYVTLNRFPFCSVLVHDTGVSSASNTFCAPLTT